MGFYFNDYDKDKKQHLNLSESAWCVIEEDIKNFYPGEKEGPLSGFLNCVFANFYEEADASVETRCLAKTSELNFLFSGKEFKDVDASSKKRMVETIVQAYRKQLSEKAKSYPKGHGEKFRINIANVDLLRDDVPEEDVYDGVIGDYLKAVYEEYCALQTYKREQIFFKETVDEINKAIADEKQLKITLLPKYDPKTKTYLSQTFYVTPYKIAQDTTQSYNYLIGVSLPEKSFGEAGAKAKKSVASIRLSRIAKIRELSSMKGFISKDKREQIEKELLLKTPQFMKGDLLNVKVRFTKKGYENYSRFLYLRPNDCTKVEGEELTYLFHCTELQAISYFVKFLRDAEILEPLYLREKFKERYRDAYSLYLDGDKGEEKKPS